MGLTEPAPAFKFVAGKLCLDFLNTVSGRLPNPRAGKRDYVDLIETERLVGFADLALWARDSEVLTAKEAADLGADAGDAPAAASRVLVRALLLREAMYRIFKAAVERWVPGPADLKVLNRELSLARSHEQIAVIAGGFDWVWSREGAGLDRVLWPVVRSAVDLLTSPELDRVAQCGGEDCHWLFLDTSRNRSRRWCAMAECGNRAKVRRFRERL